MKTLYLLLAFILNAAMCLAQSDFRQGFIITNSGDSIEGFINNKGSLKNLKKCQFKESLNDPVRTYSPEEIRAFRIYDISFYESMDIELSDGKETRFVEKLVDGVADLYYYSAQNDGFFILRTEDGNVFKLENTRKEVTNDDGSYNKMLKEYVNVLRYLFKDSPSTLEKVNELAYQTNALIDITTYYHNDVCDDYDCIVYTKKKTGLKFDLGPYVGYSISNLTLKSEEVSKMNEDFSSSSDILLGLMINVMDPNISQRFSMQFDLLYQQARYDYETTYFEMEYLRVPFSIKYTYPVKKIKPSIQVGFAYNHWLKHHGENIIPENVLGEALQKRTYQYGFLVGAQMTYPISNAVGVFMNIRYENYSGRVKNVYGVPTGLGYYAALGDYVEAKTGFISFSAGFHF